MRVSTLLAFAVSLLVQVGLPLAAALTFRRRSRAPWRLFLYGALVFAAFQLFTWLPLSTYLDVTIGQRLTSGPQAFAWLLTLALATSVIEEGGRWLGYRFLFRQTDDRWTWRNGVMYGLGQGAVESMLLIAGLTFVYLLAYVLLNSLGPEAILASLGAGAEGGTENQELTAALMTVVDTQWTQPLVVAFERAVALVHQVAWALLVMQSLVSRQKRWFGFAVLYHASIAVIVPGLARLGGFGLAEVANGLFALASLWLVMTLRAASAAHE